MDNTKKYIKMCEKAEEIQKRDFENGDIIFYKNKWGMYFKEKFYEEMVFNDNTLIKYELNPIWLPRQDQLQEMISGKYENTHFFLVAFLKFADDFGYDGNNINCTLFTSMEQLWLAFVMKKKYSKKWLTNEEKWVII